MQIIDQYFSKQIQDEIESVLSSNDFPWFFIPETVSGDKESKLPKFKNTKNTFGFKHFLYDFNEVNSNYFKDFNNLFKFNNLIRAKINLLTPIAGYKKNNHNQPHVDIDDKEHVTKIYYVNDSDGDTFFFDKNHKLIQRVTPKKGRLIVFNGLILHAGSNPIKFDRRMVININEFRH